MLDAAQDGGAEDAGEHGHQVEEGQRPDQQVEGDDLLAAVHAHKLVVATEVAAAVDKQRQRP